MEEVKRSFIGTTTNRSLTASAEDVGNVNQKASFDFAVSITVMNMDQDVLLSFWTDCPKPRPRDMM